MALGTPRNCEDDTIATARGNRSRVLRLMSAPRLNSGTAKRISRRHRESYSPRASMVRIDGDTLEIHGTRIRLWGIDAPESSQLCRDDESLRYQCGAKRTIIATRTVPEKCRSEN